MLCQLTRSHYCGGLRVQLNLAHLVTMRFNYQALSHIYRLSRSLNEMPLLRARVDLCLSLQGKADRYVTRTIMVVNTVTQLCSWKLSYLGMKYWYRDSAMK